MLKNPDAIPGNSGIITGSGIDEVYDTKVNSFTFKPYLMRKVSQKWLIGVYMDFKFEKNMREPINTSSHNNLVYFPIRREISQYGFGISSRYTLNPTNQLRVFFQPYIGYAFIEIDELSTNENHKIDGKYFDLGADLGIIYAINEHIRAVFTIGGLNYISGSREEVDTPDVDFSSLGFNLDLSTLFFGIEFKF